MRLATLAALCLAAAATTAQTPDPTPPAAYYPLGIGDVREYFSEGSPIQGIPTRLWREHVLGDTLVHGQAYQIVLRRDFDASGTSVSTGRRVMRFSVSDGGPVYLGGDGSEFRATGCRLDLPFPNAESGPVPCEAGVLIGEGPDVMVVVGADTLRTAVKTYDGLFGGEVYAAGLGLIGAVGEASGVLTTLRYARIGGVEYGTPDPILPPLAGEAPPAASALALSAGPNPTVGPLALSLSLATPSAVTVEAFDALGRRVLHATTTLGAGRQTLGLSTATWRAGLYVVRVTAGEASATARVVRR